MNFVRFNRPTTINPLATVLDEFFQKGLSELSNGVAAFNKPSVNIIEQDGAFEVQLAAPGLKKEDFDIKIDKDQLIVKVGQNKVSKDGEDEIKEGKSKYRRREFNFETFTRSFHLPKTINSDEINAIYVDGVLTITLNKKEEAKEKEPRTISIG